MQSLKAVATLFIGILRRSLVAEGTFLFGFGAKTARRRFSFEFYRKNFSYILTFL